jgi:zeaxanthin glucosyltransferase
MHPSMCANGQRGNAARVVYHKLGLRGKINRDNSKEIFSKVNYIIQNATFKENLIDMNTKVTAYNDMERISEVVEELTSPTTFSKLSV